jgi:hypothetical protein
MAHSYVPVALGVATLVATAPLAADSAPASYRLPVGKIVVADVTGHVRVVDARGRLVRRFRWSLPVPQLQAMELAADRRHAYVSIYRSERPSQLYELTLATGRRRKIANAVSPALSPDKTRLAYVTTEVRNETVYRAALVIRNVRTGAIRTMRLPPRVPFGTPPELAINWSPDGRRVAVFDDSQIKLVDAARAPDVASQPALPGDTPTPGQTSWLAPVFVDARTVVVLEGCCIGRQQLVAVDLSSGTQNPFAVLSSPVEGVRRYGQGRLLVVTALRELALVSRGKVRVIVRRIQAAAA